MTLTIVLKGMRFFAHHGVLPEERARGQEFLVDVELELPPDRELADDLDATVDYARVYATVRQVVEGPSCRLVEF
ncbi:MAG: dihydroneopterin aldolase, partial [Syntrophomonadaceae bacterium]|nr:dihydroneopterin aldolase [Syntrophomonadaceae bacterium]